MLWQVGQGGRLMRLLCGAAVTQEMPDMGRGSQPPAIAVANPAGAGSSLVGRVYVQLPPLPACGAVGMA